MCVLVAGRLWKYDWRNIGVEFERRVDRVPSNAKHQERKTGHSLRSGFTE